MDSFAQAIRSIEKHAYNYEELRHLVMSSKQEGVKLRFVNFSGLPKVLTPAHFLPGKFNAALVLLHLKNHSASSYHWITIFNSGSGMVYFDSLGLTEHELTMTLGDARLVTFLKHNKVKIGSRKVQKRAGEMLTCGAHVACRVIFGWTMNNSQYTKALRSLGPDTDKTVTLMTALPTWPFNLKPSAA
jgi:hypothetical protein